MSKMFSQHRRASGQVLSLLIVAAAGVLTMTFNSDRLIETSFNAVLEPASPSSKTVAMIAGSEDFWLKQAAQAKPGTGITLDHVVWSKPLGVGDLFVMGTGADRKELKVVAVEERSPAVTRIDHSTITAKQLWIQARDEAGGTLHTVRLDVEPALPAGRTL